MSNTERQRQFRERNPGYYGRLHRKRNAALDAAIALRAQAAMAEVVVTQQVAVAEQVAEQITVREPLMLPAPVQPMLFEDRATIPTLAEWLAEREAMLLPLESRPTPQPAARHAA